MLIQNSGQTLIIEWNVHQVAAAFFICFRVGKNFRLFAVKLIKILLHSWLERFLVWTCLNPSTSSKHTLWQHSARFPVPPATFCCPCCEGDSLHKTRQCTVIGQSTRCGCTKTDLFKRRAAIQRNGFTATANFVFSCERACLSQTNRVLWKETKIGPAVPIFISPKKKLFCHSHVSTTFFWKIVSGKGPNVHMVNICIFPARIFGAEVCGSLGKSPAISCLFFCWASSWCNWRLAARWSWW